MTQKWALKDIQQELTETGYIIVVTTFQPCHLYMRWTAIEPKEHLIPILARGIFLHSDKYFCFDVYHDNEQEEVGDTYIHTFIKEPWPVCETRWFYFYGTINGNPSPSTSPIFKKHRPGITTFYPSATAVDGMVWHDIAEPGLPWSDLIIAAGTNANHIWATSWIVRFIAAQATDKWLQLTRGIFLFDTSTLPDNATILTAVFSIQGRSKVDHLSCFPRLNIYPVNPASNNGLIPADYSTFGTTPYCDTPIPYDDFKIEDYNDFPLNAEGLAAINKQGTTKIGVRDMDYDVAGSSPAWGAPHIFPTCGFLVYMSEWGADKRPKLTITYELP